MDWSELKWYVADKDYSFALTKALTLTKEGGPKLVSTIRKGQAYCPCGLILDTLDKNSNQ